MGKGFWQVSFLFFFLVVTLFTIAFFNGKITGSTIVNFDLDSKTPSQLKSGDIAPVEEKKVCFHDCVVLDCEDEFPICLEERKSQCEEECEIESK